MTDDIANLLTCLLDGRAVRVFDLRDRSGIVETIESAESLGLIESGTMRPKSEYEAGTLGTHERSDLPRGTGAYGIRRNWIRLELHESCPHVDPDTGELERQMSIAITPAGRDRVRQMIAGLSELHLEVLRAIDACPAHSMETRRPIDDAMRKNRAADWSERSFRDAATELTARGLLGSREGRNGGYWITGAGLSALKLPA